MSRLKRRHLANQPSPDDSLDSRAGTMIHGPRIVRICRRDGIMLLLGAACVLSAGFLTWDIYSARPREDPVADDIPGFFIGSLSPAWNRDPVPYGLYIPPYFKENAGPFPLIVFLHGYGERRTEKVLHVALPPGIKNYLKRFGRFPFAALFPVDPDGQWEPGSPGVDATMAVLDHVVKRHRIDPARIYLTGHSNGGTGVWRLAEKYPEKWAAIAPLCANWQPNLELVKHLPCWVFHGEVDKIPAEGVRDLVADLRRAGGAVSYTEFPKSGHIIWPQVYYKKDVFDWFGRQKRADAGPILH